MQHFTPDDFLTSSSRYDMQTVGPRPSTLLLIKQFARMCNNHQDKENGYHHLSFFASC